MRRLTDIEIAQLERQGCSADDWSAIGVAEGFDANGVRGTLFETGSGVGAVGAASPTPRLGHIAVLNEAGRGNVLLSPLLTSQLVALMLKYGSDSLLQERLFALVGDTPCSIYLGEGVRIVNSVVSGSVIDDSTVGPNVIVRNCYIGERSTLTDGFTAYNSVFTCNSYMSCGEAVAVFAGPFTVSHHKSTLLIGGAYAFFNAGSATNFSNHAYKLGPIHYGLFERGVKTASGCHILLPANIGQFSVCFGKIEPHPNTVELPFSYVIGDGKRTWLVPGRNLCSVGFFRDMNKWARRDERRTKRSLVNFDCLSPYAVQNIRKAKRLLVDLLQTEPDENDVYQLEEFSIKASSLHKGIRCYDIALRMAENVEADEEWTDLGGMLLPLSEERRLVDDLKSGDIVSYDALLSRLAEIHNSFISEWLPSEEWREELRRDAMREYALGDVDDELIKDLCL